MRKLSPALKFFVAALFYFSTTSFLIAQNQTEIELNKVLDIAEIEFEEISVMMGTANWNVYSNEGDGNQDTPKQRYKKLFSDASLNKSIEFWSNRLDEISSPTLKRRVEVWKNVLTGAAVDFDEEIFMLENKLEALLANPGESDTAYTTEELDDMVLDLMKRRNKKAKELGYENYAIMTFEINGLGWDWMNEVVDLIDKKTIEPYKKIIESVKKDNKTNEIGYRNIGDFNNKMRMLRRFTKIESENNSSIMKQTMANIGFDYDKMPIRFIVTNIPYGGNGLAIQIPNDFRVVMKEGMPIEVWMHELGHGLQAIYNKTESSILKGYEWCLGNACAAFYEGMAETSAGFVRNDEWIRKYASNTEEELKERENILKSCSPVYLRVSMMGFLFEMEFYKDLNQDPTQLRESLFKKYLMLDKPLNAPLHLSQNIYYVAYPLYLQNYYLANIISWQVHDAIEKEFGKDFVFNKNVGNYLIENYYGEGELIDWREKMKRATGKEFDIEGYLESLGI